jgi:hypothetical protein
MLFVPTRVVFFYFDPAKMRTPEMSGAGTVLAARLFFCGRRRSSWRG